MASKVEALTRAASGEWLQQQQTFCEHFPDFVGARRAVFLVTLFAFNAATRGEGENAAIFFGMDGMADGLDVDRTMPVAMTHELSHLYQTQVAPETVNPHLWSKIWSEGLATYASARLHPDLPISIALMSRALSVASKAEIASAARLAAENLDEVGGPVSHNLLDAIRDQEATDRMGYLLGERSVRLAARKMDLRHLFRASPIEAKRFVGDALSQLLETG